MVVDRKFIALLFSTFGLVVFFGVIVVTCLFMTRPEANAAQGFAAAHEDSSGRSPASLNVRAENLAGAKVPVVMELLSLPCLSEAATDLAELTTAAKQIRLQTKSCDKLKALKMLSITNKTNGYSATIFQQEANAISTDYISLDHGKNILTFSQQTTTGETRTVALTVLRQ